MNKKTKYAYNGALFLGLGLAFINAFKQLQAIKDDPSKQFDWNRFFIEAGKGALAGAASGSIIGAIKDHHNSNIKPHNTDAILYNL